MTLVAYPKIMDSEKGAVKKFPKRKIAEVVRFQRFFGIINYATN